MGKLVYSPDPEPAPLPPAPQAAEKPLKQQMATVARDRKRRKGKTVTVISGLQHNPDTLRELLKNLQKHLCTGGTFKAGETGPESEVQADHRVCPGALLTGLGYKVKVSGG